MRKVELKNYLLYALLVVITMFLVFVIGNIYKSKTEKSKEKSILNGIISSIQYNEIENYKMENPNFVLYISSSGEEETDQMIKNLVLKQDIREDIIYLEYDHAKRIEKIKEEYVKEEFELPNLLVFENGEYKTNYVKENAKFEETLILNFLKKEGVIE